MARSDVQLMLDVKAGDNASFELLLQKYRTPLVNFLNRMVRNPAAAEDLAQEVFLRVYRARKQYAPSASNVRDCSAACIGSEHPVLRRHHPGGLEPHRQAGGAT